MYDYINNEDVKSEFMSLETLTDAIREWKGHLPTSRQYLADNCLEIINNNIGMIIHPDYPFDFITNVEEILR